MSQTVENIIPDGFKRCECGKCNEIIKINKYKPNKYKRGHGSKIKHPMWKGGRTLSPCGYVWIKDWSHPNTEKSGYVLEHIKVMSEYLGRPLKKSERVHHKNHIKTDNRIENLELCKNQSEHIKNKHKKDVSDRICLNCGSNKTYFNKKENYYKWYIYKNGYICRRCYRHL